MLRKLTVMLTLVCAALLAAPAMAFAVDSGGQPAVAATPYPAPPINTSASIEVLANSSSVGAVSAAGVPSAPSDGDLAYTGVSSDMMLLGAIAIVVIVMGVTLVVVGARRAFRRRPRHC